MRIESLRVGNKFVAALYVCTVALLCVAEPPYPGKLPTYCVVESLICCPKLATKHLSQGETVSIIGLGLSKMKRHIKCAPVKVIGIQNEDWQSLQ